MLGFEYRVRDYHANAIAIQDGVPITTVMEELRTIGDRAAWAREQRKITQQQLATRAGVAQSTIGSLESGQRKKPRELISIAKALGVSVTWLETGEGNWQDTTREPGSIYEELVLGLLEGGEVKARPLRPSDRERLPEWLRGVGSHYVPDFELTFPGAPHPVYMEVKGPGARDDRTALYRVLEDHHPGEFVLFQVDPEKTRLGLDAILWRLNATAYGTAVPAVPYAAEAPAASYGMEPILAWEHPDDLPDGEFVMIPRLDVHLSAGGGREQVEIDLVKDNPQAFRSEWIRQQRLKPAKLAAMRAAGESMEPTIHDGDSLLVDTGDNRVVDGKVYALWYDGGERVKRLFRLPGGGLRIASDNPRHPTLEVAPGELEHVRIIGRVVHRSGTGGL